MGRRALPKIEPQLDLSAHFRTLEELPQPWNPNALFTKDAPLEVEIGSGKGLFLQNAASSCPQHNFLGIEMAHKYARFTAARLAKRGLRNALAVQGDGLRLMREMIPDNTLTAVHVYFPDPWWKKRHHKRRVLNEPFLVDVYRTLRTQGRFHFWTDVQDYFEATLQLIAAHTRFVGPLDVEEKPPEHDLDFRTHFERRTRLNEQPVYRAEFIKK
ncbi:tRNA (guanosine(46)-N7)-methyltransferase TrmB [Bythopirellula polymerisocia]|uniref:tRNA (guanine-N(7)-)-methyltransferase n=1 Tax=Bythopirellula polymerisocia TaxID=2528003 RepID=A0A5C6CK95_9BACT|nr:tRNA (guanosine(46)-N7)-methyltransferase TrmB [Bythopirellula polymerisocia]TWU23721.1 tRNA (guanine-N(7)-)-methyltransferase [Bythopirellula polymerisocia]